MSYEKQTWQTGDVVTSAKLNHMEDGIAAGGGALVVTITEDTSGDNPVYTMDKTWKEIHDAATSGLVVCVFDSGGTSTLFSFISDIGYVEDIGYWVHPLSLGSFPSGEDGYIASTENDYPSFEDGGVV